MFRSLFKTKATYLLIALYVVQLVWWLSLEFFHTPSATETYIFNLAYGTIAVVSFCAAFYISRRWGGWQSLIGRMLLFLGLGLFMEWLGILAWFYYNTTGATVPYPSFADVGYFGLVPMYVIAAVLMARAAGLHFALKAGRAKFFGFLFPVAALSISGVLFLRNVGYSNSNPLKLFFDIGYPVGEIIPVTIALLVLLLATKLFNGSFMKARVRWLIFAFFFQFLAEYVFLYQAGAGTYQNANIADMLYATSYLVMGLGILSFHRIEQV